MGFLKMMLTFLVLIVMATCVTAEELLPISSYLGTHKYERVGYHVHTAGDVNGDGLDDFLVGTFHNRTRGPDSGAAYLILGRASGNWGNGISLNNADARFIGRTWYDAVGYFLGGGGDLNGDGLDDMLIGAPAGNDNVLENPGEVFIVLGRSSADWGDNFCLKNSTDGSWLGENGQDLAGISAAFIGDVNADGYDDFICGAAYNDYKTTDGGKVYLILGRSAWSRNIRLTNANASFYNSHRKGLAGYCVDGLGDVNGDNIPDFAIGARGLDRVYIMFGRRDVSWGKNFNLDNADVIISHEAAGSRTGWRVSNAGDVNGDGLNDMLVSAPEYSAVGYHQGKVYLILGRRGGWPSTFSEADASWYGEKNGDEAGYDVQTAGDFNNDGLDDFVIGAWYRDANGNNSGKVYFIQGKRSGWQQNQNLEVVDTYFDGEGAEQYAGFSCGTAGDLNGDGYDDFVSSSTYNGEAYQWGGKINIFLGHPFAPPPPTLFVSSNSIPLGREDSSAVFSVQNAGSGSFHWHISQQPADSWYLSAQPNSGELSAGESTDVHIQISRTGLAIGNYSGSLEIMAPGAEVSPQTIQFDFDVPNTIPELAETPNQVEFSGFENGTNPALQQITISNIGGGTLDWTAVVAASPDWLIISNANGTDDSQITARVDITGITPGTYSANISVQDPAAINSPLTIPISLVVRAEPVGPVLAEFEAETSDSLPNSGWALVTREESQGLEARIADVKIPPEANRLDFTFNVPEDVDGVWVFAELDVHSNSSDDSFWLTVNDQNTCNWNNLAGLGNGWKRSWVYNLGKNSQQFFDVQPGENTLSLYPREDGTIINWLVVTTDNMTDIHNYDFNETPLPPPAPQLSLLPEQIQFTAIVNGNAPESQSVQVLNAGGGDLSWTAEKLVNADWLNLMNSSGLSGDLVELQVSSAGLPIGVYTAELTFSDPDAENSPRILPVTLAVLSDKPIITVSPQSLSFEAVENGVSPTSQSIYIGNSGFGTLNWSLAESPETSWLSLATIAGTDAGTVPVTVNLSGLAPGQYTCEIAVTDSQAENSPYSIPVQFEIQPEPTGPILAQFEAEGSTSLPNSGWENVVQFEKSCLKPIVSDISSPPVVHKLEYTFNVPPSVSTVYVFGEVEVHQERNDDSFWVAMNASNTANWNGLVSLGHGWQRSWVYNQGKNTRQAFPVVSGENTLCLYPRETNGYINWLVVTTDPNQDIDGFDFFEAPPVPADPVLVAQPSNLSFSAIEGELSPVGQSITITNGGDGLLSWTATEYPDQAWLELTNPSGSSGNATTVAVNTSGLTAGNYTGTIRFSDTVASNSPLDIPVTVTVLGNEPIISIAPMQLTFSAVENAAAPAAQILRVTNSGRGILNWQASAIPDVPWLQLTPNSGEGNTSISVSVDHAALAVGTYQTTITVTDGNAVNSPQAVAVEFTVQAEPSGPILAQFEAEGSTSLPNSGWENAVQLEKSCLMAKAVNIYNPPVAHKLEYTFSVPPGVSTVYVFGDVEVHQERNDDSFWVDINETNTATWNGLVSLGRGWRRSWVYNQGKNTQQPFSVQPGENTLSLYPRESNGYINWLVITTDPNQDIDAFDFEAVPPAPADPVLVAQPINLGFSAIEGELSPADQSITVTNGGDGLLSWTAVEYPDQPWLELANTSGSSGNAVTVTVNTSGLTAGNYTGVVRFSDSNATNSPLDIPVTLTLLGNEPIISIMPTQLNFTAVENSVVPAAQVLQVTNSGRSVLNWQASAIPDVPWLQLTPNSGEGNTSISVSVDHAALAVGSYQTTITVTDVNAVNSPQAVAVQFEIQAESSGPILAQFEAEESMSLPNSGWENAVQLEKSCLMAKAVNIYNPPVEHKLEYTFTVPPGVATVYVFGDIEVHQEKNDDSFWVSINENNVANWNGLVSLGPGWRRSWVYNQGKNTKQPFPVQPGENTLCLYPRESNGYINWLVITTDPNQDIQAFEFTGGAPPEPVAPHLAIQPAQLAFVQYTGEPWPAAKQVTISNGGDGDLNWTTAIQPETSWLSISPISGNAGQKITVQTDGTSLGIGNYTADVQVLSAEADNSPLDIPVSLAVTVPQPEISASVESLVFSAIVDGETPAAVSVIVRNTGRSQIAWYATEKMERAWLTIQNASGGDGAAFQVSVSPTGLAVGTYSGIIQITDAAASNSPVEIPVEFCVIPEVTETILAAFQVERNSGLPNDGWRHTVIGNDSGLVALQNSTTQPDENYQLDYKFYVPPGVATVYVFAEVEVYNNYKKDSFWIRVNDDDLCNWESLKPICRSGWARSWVYDYPVTEKYAFTTVSDTNVISIFPREKDAVMNWLVVTTDPELDISEFEFPENLARQLAKSNDKPLPEAFRLAQNTPNPFNPSTRIEFDLPEAGLVKLAVFNLLGQEVMSLVNGNLNAGRYDIHWNACNQKGKMVASGMYFYRLTVKPTNSPRDRFMQVRKMMLTR